MMSITTTNSFVYSPIQHPHCIHRHHLGFLNFKGAAADQDLYGPRRSSVQLILRGAIGGGGGGGGSGRPSSSWDQKPYDEFPSGTKLYLDEGDVVDFLHPPKPLIPLDPSSYNAASYLWKKISDIPEERRHRLLSLLTPRHISRAWAIAGTKYVEPTLRKKFTPSLVSKGVGLSSPEYWQCRSSGGPASISWIKFFKKAIFSSGGKTYGRFFGKSILAKQLSHYFPLYFVVKQVDVVMATEQPCDLAYEFGDGVLDLVEYPQGFPKPAKHPWPFSDQVVVYIRHVGPGVLVGQIWQEGQSLEQLPKKLRNDILMVKEYQ
ncbi:hypothetical protein LguiA_002918 [Lonicera macranthoides]